MDQTEVDLHILVVPDSQWRPDLRLAYSNTCMASVSAGFVRVDPDASLDALRGEISRQLDSTSLPESYIFLRSVGRCLCIVSRSQELSLASKLFVPPLAPCPEIYILNATLTDVTHAPSPHLPGPYYSPQASSHLPNVYPTLSSTPVSTATSHSHVHFAQKHSTVQPIDHQPSETGVQNSLLKLSDMSKTFGSLRLRADSDCTKSVSPITGSAQHHNSTTLGYQPQNDSEVHKGQLAHSSSSLSDDPLAGSEGGKETVQPHHCEKSGNLVIGTSQSRKKRHMNRVHFESLTKLRGDNSHTFPPSSQDTEEVLPPLHSTQPHETKVLLAQIHQIKEEIKHLNVLKDDLSSTVRQLQRKTKARKEKDDSEWKQKLAEEKKQTKKLEKSIRKLRTDVEAVDRAGKTKKQLVERSTTNDNQHKDSGVVKSDSNHTNIKLECKRADVDVEKLRKTLDEEKRKFKIEKERHRSATDECKDLKKKLVQLKVAQNREKKSI